MIRYQVRAAHAAQRSKRLLAGPLTPLRCVRGSDGKCYTTAFPCLADFFPSPCGEGRGWGMEVLASDTELRPPLQPSPTRGREFCPLALQCFLKVPSRKRRRGKSCRLCGTGLARQVCASRTMGDLGVCRAARRPKLWVGGWIPVRRKQQESLHALPSQTAAETAPSHRELTPASGRTTGNEKPMASQSGPVTGYPGAGSSRRVRDTRGAGRAPAPVIQPWPPAPMNPPSAEPAPAPASTSPTVADIPAPATTLDRPVAIRDNRTVVDSQVQPTGLFRNRNSDPVTYSPTSDPIAYSPASGLMPAQPLPVGPSVNLNGIPLPSAASARRLRLPTCRIPGGNRRPACRRKAPPRDHRIDADGRPDSQDGPRTRPWRRADRQSGE